MAGLGAGGAAGGGGPLAGLGALVAGNSLVAIAAGLIVGVVGSGTLLATGAIHVGGGTTAPAASVAGLELVACPDVGPVIGTIPRGEKVLVTGRSADGGWLQVFYPGPAFDRAWTKAGPLRLEADASGLPVAACEAPPSPSPRPTPEASTAVVPSPEASPSPEPSPSPAASPSPSPSRAPSPRPSPSAPPSPTPTPNLPPLLAGLSASTKTISFDQGIYCPTAPKAATITVTASDASGLASVTLFWRKPGAASFASKPMTQAGGAWRASIDTAADAITAAGTLTYYVVAKDSTGATSRLPKSGASGLAVKVCANTGPTFTKQPTADATTLNGDPTGKGCGQPLGAGITAAATDPDGVASITLYFTGPGLGGTVSRLMNKDGPTWYGSINTGNDKIVGSGTITFYAIAVDSKGAKTQSKNGTINVIACGSPASIQVVITAPPIQPRTGVYALDACSDGEPPPIEFDFSITASDPDNGTQPLTVGMTWGLVNGSSGSVDSARAKVTSESGTAYSASIPSSRTNSWLVPGFYNSNTLTYTVTTTDRTGGVSTFTGKATVFVYSCSRSGGIPCSASACSSASSSRPSSARAGRSAPPRRPRRPHRAPYPARIRRTS